MFLESGQYADFPHYKVYDEFEITDLCKEGKNRFAVTVWHYGRTSLCYYPGRAALRFEIWCDGELVAFSDEGTLCRQSREYQSGLCKQITSQLGFSFHYDATEDDGWRVSGANGFEGAVTVDQELPMNKRPIKKLLLGKRAEHKTVKDELGVRVFLLSNISTYFADHASEREELEPFERCFFSAVVGHTKPHADMFEYLCRECKIKPEETLFVDDSAKNIAGAEAFGIKGYLFDGDSKKLREYIDSIFDK